MRRDLQPIFIQLLHDWIVDVLCERCDAARSRDDAIKDQLNADCSWCSDRQSHCSLVWFTHRHKIHLPLLSFPLWEFCLDEMLEHDEISLAFLEFEFILEVFAGQIEDRDVLRLKLECQDAKVKASRKESYGRLRGEILQPLERREDFGEVGVREFHPVFCSSGGDLEQAPGD